MNNGIAQAARQVESYGRGNDTMLAHITPDEAQFIDYLQGGRRTNPMTGLPEYGLFGKILKGIARAAGAIVGFTLGGPAGAALGAGLTTKVTGGSWKDALKAGALSGVGSWATRGLTGGGWGAGASPTGLADPSILAAANNQALGQAVAGAPSSVVSSTAAGGLSASTPSFMQNVLQTAKSAPGMAAGVGAIGNSMESNPAPPPLPPEGPKINLDVLPLERGYRPYEGDYNKFGQQGGGWSFFRDVNPKPTYSANGGAIRTPRGYAMGGPAMPSLPSPQVSGPGMPALQQPGMPAMGIGMGDPRQMEMRRAAMTGYMLGRARGGGVEGPGDGKSDDVPAMLSAGEHVLDADLVAKIGNGSNDAGHKKIEEWKTNIRKRAGQKNPHRPSKKIKGLGSIPDFRAPK